MTAGLGEQTRIGPLELARRLGYAARALRRALRAAQQAGEQAGLDVASATDRGLAERLEGRRVELLTEAKTLGVDPMDPRYQRAWGLDHDAIRADLRALGLRSCDFWDCLELASGEVRWRRTWAGGQLEATGGYCDRHLAELRAGAAWVGDVRVVGLDTPMDAAGERAAPPPPAGQLQLLAPLVRATPR